MLTSTKNPTCERCIHRTVCTRPKKHSDRCSQFRPNPDPTYLDQLREQRLLQVNLNRSAQRLQGFHATLQTMIEVLQHQLANLEACHYPTARLQKIQEALKVIDGYMAAEAAAVDQLSQPAKSGDRGASPPGRKNP